MHMQVYTLYIEQWSYFPHVANVRGVKFGPAQFFQPVIMHQTTLKNDGEKQSKGVRVSIM